MKKSLAVSALVAAALLGGCESIRSDRGNGRGGDVEVTRTHLGQPIARGEIRVEPAAGATAVNFSQVTAPVERELARLGWTVSPAKATTEQVAVARVAETTRANGSVATELAVRIQRRSDATVAWEGRAQTESRVGADRGATVDRLASALFRDFPGESGRTIRVR
jgi:hypothetical protein